MVKALAAALAFGAALCACGQGEIEKGRVNLGLGDYPMAIRFFASAVEAEPRRYDARLGLGQALLQKAFAEGDSAAFGYALVQLEACRSLAPSGDVSGILADAYYERVLSIPLYPTMQDGDVDRVVDALQALIR